MSEVSLCENCFPTLYVFLLKRTVPRRPELRWKISSTPSRHEHWPVHFNKKLYLFLIFFSSSRIWSNQRYSCVPIFFCFFVCFCYGRIKRETGNCLDSISRYRFLYFCRISSLIKKNTRKKRYRSWEKASMNRTYRICFDVLLSYNSRKVR